MRLTLGPFLLLNIFVDFLPIKIEREKRIKAKNGKNSFLSSKVGLKPLEGWFVYNLAIRLGFLL